MTETGPAAEAQRAAPGGQTSPDGQITRDELTDFGQSGDIGDTAGPDQRSESTRTVVVAGVANLAIALAKAAAGLISGSAAMLSESAHSVADTVTELLLFTALRRSARPADEQHPFGHGKESYFWALLAALGVLVAGAGFAVVQGVDTIQHGEESGNALPSFLVLIIAFGIECVSLARAVRQLRDVSGRWGVPMLRFLRRTPDTALIAVTLEDSAALAGLVLAGVGLALTQLTGSSVWDGCASIAIGLLLAVVAVALGKTNVSLLIGRAASSVLQEEIREELVRLPSVGRVITLMTMYLGPNSVLVAAHIDFDDNASGANLEATSDEAERRLRARFPIIRHVYLDPTPGPPADRSAGPAAPEGNLRHR
jgi:cation diffusion facilitator family transporter